MLSCQQAETPVVSEIALENLNVSESFDWRTTTDVNILLTFPGNISNILVRVVSLDEKIIYANGITINHEYSRRLTIPTYVKQIKIMFGNNVLPPDIINIEEGIVELHYGNNLKSGKAINTLPWDYTITATNHTLLIPSSVSFSGLSASPGDYIGAFYDSLGALVCAGYTSYNLSGNMFISAWGSDAGNDGFAANETMQFKVYQSSTGNVFDVDPGYNPAFPNSSSWTGNGMSAILSFTLAAASDSDNDGIDDENDAYPNDPTRALNNFYPASGYGAYAFEDLWPSAGDYDFNDLVLNFKSKTVENGNGVVVEIILKVIVRAVGASFHNGFGVQYEDVFPSWISSVSGTSILSNYISHVNGLENNQTKATIILFDDAFNLLADPVDGSIGINTDPLGTFVQPDTLTVTISFNTNLGKTINDIYASGAPNPFIIVNQNRSKEVHLPNRMPTDLADQTYFGSEDDNTNIVSGSTYKTANNLPWAFEASAEFQHTIEKTSIELGHLKFTSWIQSNGVSYQDWYMDINGYRNTQFLY